MKIIIAPDSFKDALSAYEVAEAIEQGSRMVALRHRTCRNPESTTERNRIPENRRFTFSFMCTITY